MTALTFLEGIGRAEHCEVPTDHRPRPLRFVWHHKLPQVCGGLTRPDNLASVCDSCHYSVHVLMWNMAHGVPLLHRQSPGQLTLALEGFLAAKAAGTVDRIPKEG